MIRKNSILKLDSIHFQYDQRDEDWVIENLDFTLFKDDHVAIYGPNGCGKSTFLYVLAGLLAAQKGDREADNQISTGVVFQDYSRSLLNWYTVAENLELSLRSKAKESDCKISLHKIFGDEAPTWVYNALKRFPYELSGGQRQLICLLRALLDKPAVLLLDEPFASLDVDHKGLAMDLLQRAKDYGTTAWFIIAHDLDDCLLSAERILVVQGPPIKVIQEVKVPLGWPRDYTSLSESDIQQARKKVYEVLWKTKN